MCERNERDKVGIELTGLDWENVVEREVRKGEGVKERGRDSAL